MKKYLAEGIGTFLLTLAAVVLGGQAGTGQAPLVLGALLAGITCAGGGISGGHYNPALTLGAMMHGLVDRIDFLYYWLTQFLSAGIAALMGVFLLRCSGPVEFVPQAIDPACALIAGFFGAFALVYVFLRTRQAEGGIFVSAAATGFSYFAIVATFTRVSGSFFNPALDFGLAVAGAANWGDLWFGWIGAFTGAAAAASVVRIFND